MSAVTEQIVNAVAHRSYESNGSVEVMLYPDRLEVWNPGQLPFGLTTAMLREEHNSMPTNPTLATPMYLAGYIERMGSGTTDVVNDCVEAGLREPVDVLRMTYRIEWIGGSRKGRWEIERK